MKNLVFCLLILIAGLISFSCSNNKKNIEFDRNLDISVQVQYLLVISPYAPIYENTDFQSAVINHVRKGEIYPVEGKKTSKIDGNIVKWTAVLGGWILDSDVEIYQNILRCEKAASKL